MPDTESSQASSLSERVYRALLVAYPKELRRAYGLQMTQVFKVRKYLSSAVPEGALLRHLEQFPSVKNGLSRSEAQALRAISRGKNMLREAFIASPEEQEGPIFLGDAVFALYLELLSRGSRPLVLLEGGGRISVTQVSVDTAEFWNSRAVVTGIGHEFLEGREDRIEINGIERWLEGVH